MEVVRGNNPIVTIYLYRGDLAAAEELFIAMTTKGIMPDTEIMDAFVEGYCQKGNIPTGLSMIQSCFNQYNCRPTLHAFSAFIEHCLQPRGDDVVDIWEAQRGFVIAEQLWSKSELEGLEPLKKQLKEAEKKKGL